MVSRFSEHHQEPTCVCDSCQTWLSTVIYDPLFR